MFERITEAEYLADKTCEKCGAPGVCREGSWYRTLCNEHAGGKELKGDTGVISLMIFQEVDDEDTGDSGET